MDITMIGYAGGYELLASLPRHPRLRCRRTFPRKKPTNPNNQKEMLLFDLFLLLLCYVACTSVITSSTLNGAVKRLDQFKCSFMFCLPKYSHFSWVDGISQFISLPSRQYLRLSPQPYYNERDETVVNNKCFLAVHPTVPEYFIIFPEDFVITPIINMTWRRSKRKREK